MTPLDVAVATTIEFLDALIENHRYSLLPASDVECRAAGVHRDDAHDVVHAARQRLERTEAPGHHAALTEDLETATAAAQAADTAVDDAQQHRRDLEDAFRTLLKMHSDVADRLDDIDVLRGVGDTATGQAQMMAQYGRLLDLRLLPECVW